MEKYDEYSTKTGKNDWTLDVIRRAILLVYICLFFFLSFSLFYTSPHDNENHLQAHEKYSFVTESILSHFSPEALHITNEYSMTILEV